MSVEAEPNPTVARRMLAVRFRVLREQRQRGLVEIAEFLGVAEAQASRLDTGARGYRRDQVDRLATWYGLDGKERDRLLDLAAESRKRGWWQQIDLPDSYRTLIGLEQAAEGIDEYCTGVVPGLLQTRAYADAAVRGSVLGISEQRVERAVGVRLRRQEVLARDRPPALWVVIDESVLARTTGGAAVMREQLEHLLTASDRPDVVLQVIPFEYGVHPGSFNNQLILLAMGEGQPDVVYLEGDGQPRDSSASELVLQYRATWDSLRAVASSPRDSRNLIVRYAERLAS